MARSTFPSTIGQRQLDRYGQLSTVSCAPIVATQLRQLCTLPCSTAMPLISAHQLSIDVGKALAC